MQLEIAVPPTPIVGTPGTTAHIPVSVHNRSASSTSLRLTVAPGRTAAWFHGDAVTVDLQAGATAEVELTLQLPADLVPSSTLLPYTLRADASGVDGRTYVTGLLSIAGPTVLSATLAPDHPRGSTGSRSAGTERYRLTVTSRAPTPLTLQLESRLSGPGVAEVEPAQVTVDADGETTAVVVVRPQRRLVGSPPSYGLSASGRLQDAPPGTPVLFTVQATGTARPLLANTAAVIIVLALLAVVAAGAVLLGGRWPGATPSPTASAGGAGPDAVRHPYALVDAFPRTGDRSAADAAARRLTDAGMPVRVVDSTSAAGLAGGGDPRLWVLLHDGFPSVQAARAYCERYRTIAPKCQVVP